MLDRWKHVPKFSLMGGLALGLVVLLFAFTLSSLRSVTDRVDRYQRTNTKSLCALRSDLQRRVRSGERFLIAHPQGLPGVPAATIQQGLDNERRTVQALSPLTCT